MITHLPRGACRVCGTRLAFVFFFALILGNGFLQAAALTWDSNTVTAGAQEGDGAWNPSATAFWNGATNIASANDLLTDIARFGNGGTLADVATINADTQSINGLIFGATSTHGYLVSSDSTSLLTTGAGGLVVNSGAQATTLGSANLSLTLGANQTWTNNSTAPLILDGFVNGGAKVFTLSGTGPVNFTAGFSNLGLNSIFNSGTTVNITEDATISTALFANGNTTISAGTTQSANQIIVINNTGLLMARDTGILTGAQLRIGSTSGQAANLTVASGGQVMAAGSIASSHAGGTVPSALVNKGFKVRVGAHSWDLTAKDRIERIDRMSRVYAITSTTTKIANPFGGGIYVEVPCLANAGIVSVQIANAVRSPFFSSTSFHRTTLSEWQDTERTHPGPWTDFETDRFMMQVPRSWTYAFADPVTLMADWDKAMDAVSDLMGLLLVRPKTVMSAQLDVILRADVNAPGYP